MCDNGFFWWFHDGKFRIFIPLVLKGVNKRLKRKNDPLFKPLFEMKFISRHQTIRVFVSELYICYFVEDKRRLMWDNRFFWQFRDGKFWISVSLVLKGVRKSLKRKNVPRFKLLLEMKFILTHQTWQVFVSGLHLFHFNKEMRRDAMRRLVWQ